MAMDSLDDKKWEDAFIRFGFDAAVGRLFSGIIHNLNGVGQAFSMQAELLTMMFGQADKLLEEIGRAESLAEARSKSAELRKVLARRAVLVGHLTDEVNVFQRTMQRTMGFNEGIRNPTGDKPFKLDAAIMIEMEFLNSDGFFKHKIKKRLTLAENIQVFAAQRVEIHQILAVLLENASQALAANLAAEPAPEISIVTTSDGINAEITVCDNGPGIAAADLERIFTPFFTTRTGHLGLGLYLARVMAANSGGSLTCASSVGRTCFTLKMPVMGGRA
jgi:signal transduction histidine kinase